ncbi:MAG: histidine phosphatase family protein [Pseudomonadota bacterium]
MNSRTDRPAPQSNLALLRHGRTAWNRAHRLQGRTDVPLDEEGRLEVSRLRLPPDWRDARIVSSPLERAIETAELLAPETVVSVEPRLTELDFGDWEGRQGAKLKANPDSGFRDIEHWGWGFRPPNGESLTELRDRVSAYLREVARSTTPVLAVCHINVMRVVLALAHGWDFDGPPPFQIKRGRLYPLRLEADGTPRPDGPAVRLHREGAPS